MANQAKGDTLARWIYNVAINMGEVIVERLATIVSIIAVADGRVSAVAKRVQNGNPARILWNAVAPEDIAVFISQLGRYLAGFCAPPWPLSDEIDLVASEVRSCRPCSRGEPGHDTGQQ